MPNRWKPNVTVAAIIEREGRFLLVEEDTADGLRLNNPAGHLDPAESLEQACVREVLEETAFDFVPSALVGVYMTRFTKTRTGHDTTYVRFSFAGSVGQFDSARILDEGIVRTLWLTYEEIVASADRHRSPLLLRGIDDYRAGRRFPLGMIHTESSVFGLDAEPAAAPTAPLVA